MQRRLAVVLTLLVLLPLGLLAWLGLRVADAEEARLRRRFDALLQERLDGVDATVQRLLDRRRDALARTTATLTDRSTAALRRLVRQTPAVGQAARVDAAGRLLHPPLDGVRTDAEQRFLARTRTLWEDRIFPRTDAETMDAQPGPAAPPAAAGVRQGRTRSAAAQAGRAPSAPPGPAGVAEDGWFPWYWENGLHLLYWRRLPDGGALVLELSRARFLADLIAALPATAPAGNAPDPDAAALRRVALRDGNGAVLYQWGHYAPAADQAPAAARALSPPFGSWRATVHLDPGALALGRAALAPLLGGGLAVALATAGLAFYFYREHTRAVREAATRVSFVNQASHELKTPLTNIRMYAELLADDLDDADARAHERATVIVEESERLSRIIGNILAFARRQRGTLAVRPAPRVVDACVAEIVERFRPQLARAGLTVALTPGAPGRVRVDADALAQILGNLLGNAEKYAGSGAVRITTGQPGDGTTRISVADEGPGIPAGERERIFLPFHRLSNAVSEGASGAGIGLAVARELARLHGGDLTCEAVERGAAFRLVIATPPAESKTETTG